MTEELITRVQAIVIAFSFLFSIDILQNFPKTRPYHGAPDVLFTANLVWKK
jgi:hypothetical protein